MCIDVLIREYFNAKKIPLETIPFIRIPCANANKQVALFKGGIVAIKMVGKGGGKFVGDLPLEAKLINRTLNANIFKYSDGERIKKHNMNGVVVLMENFGDVSLLWMVPNPAKIFDYMQKALVDIFGTYQYVNHGIMMHVNKVNKEQAVRIMDKEKLGVFLQSIETFLNTEFVYMMNGHFTFVGFETNKLYFEYKDNVYVMSLMLDEDVQDKLVDLSDYSTKLIDKL